MQNYRGLDDLLEPSLESAELGKRFFAGVVDYIIVQTLLFVVMVFVVEESETAWLQMFLVSLVVNWLYSAGMESSERQATIGKMLVNIKVVDLRGRRVSFFVATNRFFAKYLSSLLLFVGYLMIIFDSKNQGLHDKIARTLVVKA